MTWTLYHGESERLAIEAQLARGQRELERAERLYEEAGDRERLAFDSLDASKARTRGITGVSAVALWFKARAYAKSEQFAHVLLADPTMPPFAREDLRILLQSIWIEAAKQSAGVGFLPGQVMVSVKGGTVVTGGAPLDLIVDKVQMIQSMFYRTLEYLNGVPHRKVGRPSRELQEACQPWLFQTAPGSYQFSVAVQKPVQANFLRPSVEPDRVAGHFLEIVTASAVPESGELDRLVPDETYRSTFLKMARNLAPTGKAFETIEFRSAEGRPIALGVEARVLMTKRLRAAAPKVAAEEEEVELVGVLRAVDLNKDWLDLLEEGGDSRHVTGLAEALDDVIGPMVNRRVVVRALRTKAKKLLFRDVELAD